MEKQCCKFWLPKKRRFCANTPLNGSLFCGNHKPDSEQLRIPCPIDPSHSILQENLEAHIKRCPFQKQVQALETQPFYKKGVNSGRDEDDLVSSTDTEACIAKHTGTMISCTKSCTESSNISSEMKRNMIYKMTTEEFSELIRKIKAAHCSIFSRIQDSYAIPEACSRWLKKQIDKTLPFQEKHVQQQASILGNLEVFGILGKPVDLIGPEFKEHVGCDDSLRDKVEAPAVVEFGAGRGYLTQMLTDCYGIKKVFLVERKSYKLKADRSLRQKQSMLLERLRIDTMLFVSQSHDLQMFMQLHCLEDLNLSSIESLRGSPYVAIGKHLCGPATDLTLRCCVPEQYSPDKILHSNGNCYLRGLALATCCHHLCQWKHYINKRFFLSLGITKEEFHAITWFTSWAVDADHGSDLSDVVNQGLHLHTTAGKESNGDIASGVEDIVRNMKAVDRAVLGFICKDIIDIGRLMWVKEHGLEAQLVKYVPANISPENHLLVAKVF